MDYNMVHSQMEASNPTSLALSSDAQEEAMDLSRNRYYYASQSDVTDPGRMTNLLANLPNNIEELRRVAQGLVIHYRSDGVIEHGVPVERMKEIDTRHVEKMLARLIDLKEGSLATLRSPLERLVGCCRDFTVLFLAMARSQGIPARARVGFATYFHPGYYVDHEVAEVWDDKEQRWRLVDPQLVDDYKSPDGISIDPLDLHPDVFLVAGSAWQKCRAGIIDPEIFVVSPNLEIEKTRGWPEIHHNLIHDLATLNKIEMLLWDEWSIPWGELVDHDFSRLNKLAEQTSVADPSIANLIKIYKNDLDLQVPDTVLSENPLGGPCRKVSWLRKQHS